MQCKHARVVSPLPLRLLHVLLLFPRSFAHPVSPVCRPCIPYVPPITPPLHLPSTPPPHLKLVRDAFDLAKEKSKDRGGAIIFIDELDAIGTKRYGGDKSGDREVQRTMLELLNQLDGFNANTKIKVIAATNRPDVLDPALLR